MTKLSSTMFTVGTLLRHAEDAGAHVRALVQGCWVEGVVIGCDSLGAVLDDGEGHQVLVRLESVVAVSFSRAQMEDDDASGQARPQPARQRDPIEAGPVTVPAPSAGFDFVTAGQC